MSDRNVGMSMMDQLQAAIKEIFSERGYDMDESLPVDNGVGHGMSLQFKMKNGKQPTQEEFNAVTTEAIFRIGGKPVNE